MTELENLESDMLRAVYGIKSVRSASKAPAHFRDKAPIPLVNDTYTIQSGDNLTSIAKRTGTTVAELLTLNPQYRKNPNMIRSGEKLRLREQGRGAPAPLSESRAEQIKAQLAKGRTELGVNTSLDNMGAALPLDEELEMLAGLIPGAAIGGRVVSTTARSLKEALKPMAKKGSMHPHIDPEIQMAHGMSRQGQQRLSGAPLKLARDRRYGRDYYPPGTGLDMNHPNQGAAFKQWLDDFEAAPFAPDPLLVASRMGY
jgi:hypothetical protein